VTVGTEQGHVRDVVITNMTAEDWPEVRRIYGQGIATGQATFETDVPEWNEWDSEHLPGPRLVARSGDRVLGWGALSPTSRRSVYSGVVEASVYVGQEDRSRGVGRALLEALIGASEEADLWTLQAVVFPENGASVALLRRCGFREVGRRERLARDHGEWRDVVLFERRSSKVG
jgi:L-amino acid N-acyltransferase YncA